VSKLFVQKSEKSNKWQTITRNKLIVIPVIIILIVLLTMLSFALYMRTFMYSQNQITKTTEFTISKGEDVRAVTKSLSEKKIIKKGWPFLLYLKYKGLSGQLIAGVYLIDPKLTPMEVADILTNGKVASKRITIPEGWTINEIGDYLEKNKIVTKKDFIAATKDKYNYDFLKSKPDNVGLEGYLFPDTYQISYRESSSDIINKMLKNFGKKTGDSQLTAEIAGSGMSLHQVITLASIVEREASKPEDRKVVAGIFLSRLQEGMPLQSDVTVLYALGVNKKTLTNEETQIASPYNTYVNKGLPIGPINNPGLDSIDAVLNPSMTEYRYFLAADGVVYYSKTLAEHQEKVAKYLQ